MVPLQVLNGLIVRGTVDGSMVYEAWLVARRPVIMPVNLVGPGYFLLGACTVTRTRMALSLQRAGLVEMQACSSAASK
jgi:hypothetical protein